MKEGALLGKWPMKSGQGKAKSMKRTALTGDEKKAIMAGIVRTPNTTAGVSASEAVRIQRDQALSQIGILRKERAAWEPVIAEHTIQIKALRNKVEDQEAELKALKSLTVWQFIRKKLAAWLAP